MKIRYIEISGFKGVDASVRYYLSPLPRNISDLSLADDSLFLYKTIHGIVFGFNTWQKEIFRGDPKKNKTFTGLLNIELDDRELLIERDFETNFVACVSIQKNKMRTIYQGKDIILNGSHKVYLRTIKELIPDIIDSLNEVFQQIKYERMKIAKTVNSDNVSSDSAAVGNVSSNGNKNQRETSSLRLYIPEKTESAVQKLSPEEHSCLFYEIFNKANDAIFLWALNPDLTPGYCIEANRAALELTGYSLAELRKMTFLDIKPPQYREQISKLIKELTDKGQLYIETVNRTKDGKQIPVGINAHAFYIDGERVVLSVTRDISERKRFEQELENSNIKYRALFENAKDAVLLLNKTKIIDCNHSTTILLNTDKEKIIGREFHELCHRIIPDGKRRDQEGQIKDILQIVLTGQKKYFECQFRKSDGSLVDAEVCFDSLQLNKQIFVQAIIRDITKIRQTEKKLKEKNLLYKNFFQNTLVGIWRLEFPTPISTSLSPREIARKIFYEGVCTECNQAFLRMYGRSNEKEILGQNPSIFSIDHKKSLDRLEQFVQNNFRADVVETIEKDMNGKRRFFNNSYIGQIENGKLVWMWGLQIDVTQQKELEEQFLQSQKMEAVGMLAGGIAHDFNNILTVINGYSDILTRKINPDDPLYKYIIHIRKAGERASHLTGQLLSFSRRQVFQTRILNLNTIITGMISMIQRIIGENIEIVTRLLTNLKPIKFDESKIEQIIMNMVVNAKDAMPNGGKLFMETRNVYLDDDYCTTHPEAQIGEYVQLTISDTGYGISEDVIQHIFEPFFTTKEKGVGTGLGLATVYGIIKQAHGHITVRSQKGQGTTFFIYFPKSSEETEEVLEKETVKLIEDLRGNETILVVEDDETVRQVMVETLNNYGYRVLEAMDGSEALEIYALSSDQIDLIISDIVMPRMDGKEFKKRIMKGDPDCRFIFMSGYTDNSILNFEDLQNVDLIQKPFKLNELVKKIRSVLDKDKSDTGF
ncbi:MAG: PAS domain S-box protein [Calditrichaeota bacterium]|nr:PAS domain S-box protein [Calditrichota bacterium]